MFAEVFFAITTIFFSAMLGILISHRRFAHIAITDIVDVVTILVMLVYNVYTSLIICGFQILFFSVLVALVFISLYFGYIYGMGLTLEFNKRLNSYCHLKRSELISGGHPNEIEIDIDSIFGNEED